ncbi:MAG: hypothetical protein IJZ29_02535 [Clostridia bacterium]|nr:hypothetical protein [Clostridia bacterium]
MKILKTKVYKVADNIYVDYLVIEAIRKYFKMPSKSPNWKTYFLIEHPLIKNLLGSGGFARVVKGKHLTYVDDCCGESQLESSDDKIFTYYLTKRGLKFFYQPLFSYRFPYIKGKMKSVLCNEKELEMVKE